VTVAARRAIPNGVWAVAMLICAESTVFGALIGSYFYLRSNAARWPPAGIDAPSIPLPLAITGALVLTAVAMFVASEAAREGRTATTLRLALIALLVQAGYLAVQIVRFRSDLLKFTPHGAGSYGSIYFTMLAADHAHVAVGLLLDVWLLARVGIGGLTRYRVVAARAIAWYWYFVAALTTAVTLTQLSPSL
jgi:cytochrome c oxidase subunit III